MLIFPDINIPCCKCANPHVYIPYVKTQVNANITQYKYAHVNAAIHMFT